MSDIRRRVAKYAFEKLVDAVIVLSVVGLTWAVISFLFTLDFK